MTTLYSMLGLFPVMAAVLVHGNENRHNIRGISRDPKNVIEWNDYNDPGTMMLRNNLDRLKSFNQNNQHEKIKTSSDFIPDEYKLEDSKLLSLDDPRFLPFPRWNVNDTNSNYTMMESIIDFLKLKVNMYDETDNHTVVSTGDHHQLKYGRTSPETLYVMRSEGVYASTAQLKINACGTITRAKVLATNNIVSLSLHILKSSSRGALEWPRLYQLLIVDQMDIPFLVFLEDYTGCNLNNWRDSQSVPLFTVAANIDCHHTFPLPNYETYNDSRETASSSYNHTDVSTWETKIPKVVWRGGLTGSMPANESLRGPRYHLTKLVHSEQISEEQRNLFDIKLTNLRDVENFNITDGTELGYNGLNKDYMDYHAYGNYRAILDVDGHSWSSRFGKLLCMQSVVLKVEPQEVDYFHYKRDKEDGTMLLVPWKHYIPVKRDFSDLIAKAKYATSNENAEHITEIIANANVWCSTYMVRDAVASDALDVWESYVNMLDTYSDGWQDQWIEQRNTIMSGPFQMEPVKQQYCELYEEDRPLGTRSNEKH